MKIIVKSTKTISFDEQFEDSSASETEFTIVEQAKVERPVISANKKSILELPKLKDVHEELELPEEDPNVAENLKSPKSEISQVEAPAMMESPGSEGIPDISY